MGRAGYRILVYADIGRKEARDKIKAGPAGRGSYNQTPVRHRPKQTQVGLDMLHDRLSIDQDQIVQPILTNIGGVEAERRNQLGRCW